MGERGGIRPRIIEMTPAFSLQLCGWLVGIPLQFLLIAALMRSAYKQFPFVFAYAVANLLTTAIEVPTNVRSVVTGDPAVLVHFAKIYWVDEWVLQVLVFGVVISLFYVATNETQSRRLLRSGLIAGALVVAVVSFLIQYDPRANTGRWMTPWTRDLSFCAAILDLALWAKLISSKVRDTRLLLVSGALGLQFTGEAIGEAIRNLSIAHSTEWVSLLGSVVTMVANLACLYVWWRTFRPVEVRESVAQL